jgi:hypothetical protein
MPPKFIRFPARMKKGTARRGKLYTPPTIRCIADERGMLAVFKKIRELARRQKEMGIPKAARNKKETRTAVISSPPLQKVWPLWFCKCSRIVADLSK